jgi:hypothetical protein
LALNATTDALDTRVNILEASVEGIKTGVTKA